MPAHPSLIEEPPQSVVAPGHPYAHKLPNVWALNTNGVDEYPRSTTAQARHTDTGYTVGQWRYLPSNAGLSRALWAIAWNASDQNYVYVFASAAGEFYYSNRSSASGIATDLTAASFVPTDEWFRVIWRVEKKGVNFEVRVLCTYGGSINTDVLTGVWHDPSGPPSMFSLAHLPRFTPIGWNNGSIGCSIHWDKPLSDDEMTAWLKSYNPFLFLPVDAYVVDHPEFHGGRDSTVGDAPDVGLGDATVYDLTGVNMLASNIVRSPQVVLVP